MTLKESQNFVINQNSENSVFNDVNNSRTRLVYVIFKTVERCWISSYKNRLLTKTLQRWSSLATIAKASSDNLSSSDDGLMLA